MVQSEHEDTFRLIQGFLQHTFGVHDVLHKLWG